MKTAAERSLNLRRWRWVAAIAVALIIAAMLWSDPAAGQTEQAQWAELNEAAVAAYRAGDYAAGTDAAGAALNLARAAFGDRDPRTLRSLDTLAALYMIQGRSGEVEPLFTQALELRREVFGPTHLETLKSLNSLAGLYWSQGRYGEAEALFAQTLELRREVLGPTHPDTLTSLNNLASLYGRQGHDDEAEDLRTQASGLRRQQAAE